MIQTCSDANRNAMTIIMTDAGANITLLRGRCAARLGLPGLLLRTP